MLRIGKILPTAGHGKKKGDGGYIATSLSVYPRALLIVIAKAISIGNGLLHSLIRMVGFKGPN